MKNIHRTGITDFLRYRTGTRASMIVCQEKVYAVWEHSPQRVFGEWPGLPMGRWRVLSFIMSTSPETLWTGPDECLFSSADSYQRCCDIIGGIVDELAREWEFHRANGRMVWTLANEHLQ